MAYSFFEEAAPFEHGEALVGGEGATVSGSFAGLAAGQDFGGFSKAGCNAVGVAFAVGEVLVPHGFFSFADVVVEFGHVFIAGSTGKFGGPLGVPLADIFGVGSLGAIKKLGAATGTLFTKGGETVEGGGVGREV